MGFSKTPGSLLRAQFTPHVVQLDKRFRYKLGNTPILWLYRGMMGAEGPAWNGVGRYLTWSDIPNDEQLRWIEEDGHVSRRFRSPNGNTFDYQGRQLACEHGNRRVVRYENNGKVTVLADQADGTPLNAPNDAVVHPNDGAISFADPGYGALMDYTAPPRHRVRRARSSRSRRRRSTGSKRRAAESTRSPTAR